MSLSVAADIRTPSLPAPRRVEQTAPATRAAAPTGPIQDGSELHQRLLRSPTGQWLTDQFQRYGGMPEVRIASDAELEADGMPAATNGVYDRRDHVVTIRASLLQERPEQAVTTYAHELFHALDNVSGVSPSIKPALSEAYAAAGRPQDDASADLVVREAKLITESRAYAFAARVMHELDLSGEDAGKVTRAALQGASPDEAYAHAWNALERRDSLGDIPIRYAPGMTTAY